MYTGTLRETSPRDRSRSYLRVTANACSSAGVPAYLSHSPAQDVGGGRLIASVREPDGTLVGLLHCWPAEDPFAAPVRSETIPTVQLCYDRGEQERQRDRIRGVALADVRGEPLPRTQPRRAGTRMPTPFHCGHAACIVVVTPSAFRTRQWTVVFRMI